MQIFKLLLKESNFQSYMGKLRVQKNVFTLRNQFSQVLTAFENVRSKKVFICEIFRSMISKRWGGSSNRLLYILSLFIYIRKSVGI